MKYLLLLLISFNVHAQFKVEVTKNGVVKFGAPFETLELANEWIADNVKVLNGKKHRNSFGLKARWLRKELADVATREAVINEYEVAAPLPDGWVEGDELPAPIIMQDKVTEYRHPKTYKVKTTDISVEMQAEKDAKEADRLERIEVKASIQDVNDSDLPGWHKKILRKLIRDMKD